MENVVLKLSKILRQVSSVESPDQQIRLLVDSVTDAINMDVCSLYLLNEEKEIVLVASHGLSLEREVVIPQGSGLIGQVVSNKHPINVADASSHADFLFVPEIGEERYKSFCGVPLVRAGEVVGGLVVQSIRAEKLTEEHQALLVTLAAQLALLIPASTELRSRRSINIRVSGVRGSPGLGVGKARLCGYDRLASVPDAHSDEPAANIVQWQQLKARVADALVDERQHFDERCSENITAIFDTYLMLLKDPLFDERVHTELENGHWLPGALRNAVDHFVTAFQAIDDPYLAARADDFVHLGNKLFAAWQGESLSQAPVTGPVVLVGDQISVSDIAAVPPEFLAGVVCIKGSHLSHTAVLANALGVPAVMGVGALHALTPGTDLIVNADGQYLILNPGNALIKEYTMLIAQQRSRNKQLARLVGQPAVTGDGHRIRLLTNTGLLADISPGLQAGAEGVGLYRTEIPFMVCQAFPSEDEQVEVYQKVLAAYPDKPVYMRVLDIGGDKQLPYFPIRDEENPALGWRGVRFVLDNIQLLMTQIRAMLRASVGHPGLHILLPMVSSLQEIQAFRTTLQDALVQLKKEGMTPAMPKVGVMVEVPAAISQLHFWRPYIDFVSIGSNDLSQYLLSLDRNNARVAARYDAVHPAVISEVNRTVTIARELDLPLSLCGEIASDPVAVVLLIGMGVQSLSLSAAHLPKVKQLIRAADFAQAQTITQKALTLPTATEIRSLVQTYITSLDLSRIR